MAVHTRCESHNERIFHCVVLALFEARHLTPTCIILVQCTIDGTQPIDTLKGPHAVQPGSDVLLCGVSAR